MEDKRRDSTGTPPPSASLAEASPSEQPTSRRRGGLKRKSASINSGGSATAPQTTSFKRQAREKPTPVPFPPIHMSGPCTRARVQPYNSYSFSEVTPVKSEAEVREAAQRAEEIRRVSENWEALEAKIDAEYEAIKSRDANVHVVPVHAGWFSWTKIHQLEERMLPSFFSGKSESRTPGLYMEIRNWLMKKFHHNPDVEIELKHLAELTVGDLDAQQEVLEFLAYWGLINYHPFPHQDPAPTPTPTPAPAPAPMVVDSDANGDAAKDESEKIDSLVEKLFQFETVQSWTPTVPSMNMASQAMSSRLFPESVVADELVKSEGPSVEYHCNSCSADCSRKRYHCQKQADFDLCADCFNNGKFGSDMSPSDFILMEPGESGGVSGGKWTDQETLLLLEAIELFRDNWSEIAEHVATKTKAQCILHFVQMPIEDAFFNQDDGSSDVPKENGAPLSLSTEDSAPKAEKDCDNALTDMTEKKEIERGTTDNQDPSCPREISRPDKVEESDERLEAEANFALKALKEAFEAVGSFPSPGERLSFAEAGNPVMALAAYLVRLVDPTIATASVHSLLKSLSSNYSGEQLAAKHCFPLEDPPEDKNLDDSDRVAAETIEHEGQKEKTTDSVVDGTKSRDNGNDENNDSASQEHDQKKDSASDQKAMASPSRDHTGRSDSVKPDRMATHEESHPAKESEPSNSDSKKERPPKTAEESAVSASHNAGESQDGASAGEACQSKEPSKDEDMVSVSEKKEADLLAISSSTAEKEDNTGDRKTKEDSEKKELLLTKGDLGKNEKLKRAAVTALSAAAVKAKLLADQEEDQILQLSTFLVEKQLYKLETKLAFFSDMENIVMRVKEQLDRSKQRLFQERAHIIATRFGMSASARPTSQNLPPNRSAPNFPNSAARPFVGMNSLRPPISRPMVTANPTSSNFMTASSTGSSAQPNASVGMK